MECPYTPVLELCTAASLKLDQVIRVSLVTGQHAICARRTIKHRMKLRHRSSVSLVCSRIIFVAHCAFTSYNTRKVDVFHALCTFLWRWFHREAGGIAKGGGLKKNNGHLAALIAYNIQICHSENILFIIVHIHTSN